MSERSLDPQRPSVPVFEPRTASSPGPTAPPDPQSWIDRFATITPRLGQGRGDGDPLVPPIVASTTFCRDGIESDARHKYSRESNPTVAALEAALGELENAPPALAFATGLAAEATLFQAFLKAGDHVVCSRAVYGGTTRLLEQVYSPFDVSVTFVDTTDVAAVEAALEPNTRLVFLETPANPTLDLTDIAAISEIAREAGALVAVDNTFLTPLLQRPLELGADFSIYSTTKFLEGHSAALGGAIITRDRAHLDHLAFVRKCIGNIQSPFNAWVTLQGLKTLPVRFARQCATADTVARALAERDDIAHVYYPSLATDEAAAIAERQHLGAHGAVVTFELAGGLAAARALLERVKLCRLVEHVGSVETLLTHPATMTHGGVSPEQRRASGISDTLLRLSVGLEPAAAILNDLFPANATVASASPSVSAREEVGCVDA